MQAAQEQIRQRALVLLLDSTPGHIEAVTADGHQIVGIQRAAELQLQQLTDNAFCVSLKTGVCA
ncbi:hypothetical protein D3C84_1004950 [compost metagenome]